MIKFLCTAAISVMLGYSVPGNSDIKPTTADVAPQLRLMPEPTFLVVPVLCCPTMGLSMEEAAKQCFKTQRGWLYM
jgi:hypothetical protein